jgi:putative addiction module killer protein
VTGAGVTELRIHSGPGYACTTCKHRQQLILLLCGGDKSTQSADIDKAHELTGLWKKENADE